MIPIIFMGGWSGSCSDAALVPVGFLAVQRSYELEADAAAVQVVARAGFDPGGVADAPAVAYQVTSSEFIAVQNEVGLIGRPPQ